MEKVLLQNWDLFFPFISKPQSINLVSGERRRNSEHTFMTFYVKNEDNKSIAIIKLQQNPNSTLSQAALQNEYDSLKALNDFKIKNIPKPLFFGRFGPLLMLTMTCLPGVHFYKYLETDNLDLKFFESVLSWYLDYHRTWRQASSFIDLNQFNTDVDTYLSFFQSTLNSEYNNLKDNIYSSINTITSAYPNGIPAFFQHNDQNPWNALYENNKLYFFDFEDCLLKGYPLMDIYYFYIITAIIFSNYQFNVKNEIFSESLNQILVSSLKKQINYYKNELGFSQEVIDAFFNLFCLNNIYIDLEPKRANVQQAKRWVKLLQDGFQEEIAYKTLMLLFYRTMSIKANAIKKIDRANYYRQKCNALLN